METSSTTKELTLALCQFQASQIKAAKSNTNPAFKTKYAGINEVLDAVLGTLTENGLCFVQFPDGENGLTTRLMHVSGEWLQANYTMRPAQPTPQGMGSAMTYARRYALLAVLGLGTEDDDGHAASQPAPPKQKPSSSLKNELRDIASAVLGYGPNAYASKALAELESMDADRAAGGLAFFKKELHRLSLTANDGPHD